MSGTLPLTIGNFQSLSALSLTGCKIGGTIPSAIGALTSLTILDISLNSLNGTMHHIVPTNEHQDGSVACNASCDRNESFKFAILNVIEE